MILVAAILAFWVIGFFTGRMSKNCDPLPVSQPHIDTLLVPVPQPPDIVTIEYPGFDYAQPPGDIVFIDTGSTRLDTVFVDSSRAVHRSQKTYRFKYVESKITAWAAAPVDSFSNQIVIDWERHYREQFAPSITIELHRQRNRGRIEGGLLGVAAAIGIVWAVR